MPAATVAWGSLFALDVPADWAWEDQSDVISLYRKEGGLGAIQVSLARRNRADEPSRFEAEELARSAAVQWINRLEEPRIRTMEIGGCPASMFSVVVDTTDERVYWQAWNIVGRERVAFITYTCDAADAGLESAERDEIVKSFHWL